MGATAITVIGPVSGRRYHFQGRGAQLPIDLRDVPSLAGIPHLRRV